MTRIGLTLDEHFDLRVKPRTGADPAFHEAAEQERYRMFPMATVAASHHLRFRGYDCRPAILDALVRQEAVTPSQPNAKTHADASPTADRATTQNLRYALASPGVSEQWSRGESNPRPVAVRATPLRA